MEVQRARAVNLKAGHFERGNERIHKYTLGDNLHTKLSELSLLPAAVATSRDRNEDFTVRRITRDDQERVLQFLKKFFFRDEPLNVAVQLLDSPDSRCLALEEYSVSSLDDEVSVAAVDRCGDIVGVVINGISRKEEQVDVLAKAEECPDAKFSRVLRVLERLDEQARVWEHVGDARSVLEVRIASTHADWRGKGLMRRLCEETEELARSKGCRALRMDATSAFSAAVAERLGYTRVYSVKYDDIERAPRPCAPHYVASVYIKNI